MLTVEQRDQFDSILEQVLEELPASVKEILEEVPLIVEDYPSDQIMQEMKVRRRGDLCGLYTGVPLTEGAGRLGRRYPDRILIFRLGILRSADMNATDAERELKRQIKITILHEVGHHHGLSERDLEELGYG
ncbi:MAG: metallopeptidase family protein [Planctomycetota bacterium]|nr:metallopeptidase family protein [Planctomycetota bacterium]